MKRKKRKQVAIGVLPILCINFWMNLPRLQFDHLTVSKIVINLIVLIHPFLIGIILYNLWKWRNTD
ncbi:MULTISPECIES: hypothetical protein [unclassified Streptococcus]|uniref:hypothetical protein n=1 Tax=unclassified Streptococcus TaxID=2608887 RepID=UPI0010723FA4|nr:MULTISPECIES: hypothetical protein [unclassified Streptococcus]MBF0787127.1 hypothetical protein [Streptococcus sp. 19428wC2_LYSM12]MCQ9211317.1 hypothetical protein [Streptococcus sp. B01]MCQ9214629.1 hypothetical protein [Streptococcus sp. O1]TFV06011.1 hypothetical protein E4T79_04360 [Streptococcus sp. LYSM12]